MIRKSYAALRNLVTSLPNPNPDPDPNISGQVESESEKKKQLGSASLVLAKLSPVNSLYGVCSIFLRVDRSINEIHKPRILNTIQVFFKKYVFIYY